MWAWSHATMLEDGCHYLSSHNQASSCKDVCFKTISWGSSVIMCDKGEGKKLPKKRDTLCGQPRTRTEVDE